ncbi:hypothetical protein [Streptomyces sp. NPDC051561]|uniref:hypothetical protein n=1 Tax=Streptomyces sp. NPDC051561 TaxID=3365658 RepID=UPI0037A88BEF
MTSQLINVGDVLDRLAHFDRASQIRLAVNPDFPFAHLIDDLVEARDPLGDRVVYIGEAGQDGFLPAEAARLLGWHPPLPVPLRVRRRTTRPAADC